MNNIVPIRVDSDNLTDQLYSALYEVLAEYDDQLHVIAITGVLEAIKFEYLYAMQEEE